MTKSNITKMDLIMLAYLLPGIVTSAWADCTADANWLKPLAPLAVFDNPAPPRHGEPNSSDCPFYQAAWQVFLYATQPEKGADGKVVPHFLISQDFFTIEQTFKSLPTTSLPSIGAGISQAISLAPLIDKNGNPTFYAIHMNDTMKEFFTKNKLLSVPDIVKAQEDPRFGDLEFPPGSIELKSAWQIVSDTSPPEGFFVTKAKLPWLKFQNNQFIVDTSRDPRIKTVALVAIHVVFTLQEHPEFIWSTFEHIDTKWHQPDTAPSATHSPQAPSSPLANEVVLNPDIDYLFFKPGLEQNKAPSSQELLNNFDSEKQSFTKQGSPFQTSVYRVFPASKSLTDSVDPDVLQVNKNMVDVVFKNANTRSTDDRRDNFTLMGATWMNDPRGKGNPNNSFQAGTFIRNKPGEDPDDPNSKMAGEDMGSNPDIESFTQHSVVSRPRDPNSRPNCFFCHDTKPISQDGVEIKKSKLNVSHILSRYLLDTQSLMQSP